MQKKFSSKPEALNTKVAEMEAFEHQQK